MSWFASEALLNRLMRSDTDDKKYYDKGSLKLLWIMIAIANALGILFCIVIKMPISSGYLPYIGLVFIIIGMVFRFISIWTLGRFFTVDITIKEGHTIKKDGVYKIIRHPSYLGMLLSFIGFGISLNNWLSLITITLLITIGLLIRIKIEEIALIEKFGAHYLDYRNSTYCLIPWIY